ncbi:hypothetical protein P4562_08080 [Lysinibacillus xylanilyticus]|uniref:hypothetical protein n=1 Tax=Lysinibacillus xylanilyticus TaxID=582475 RepID=UPI002E22D809|nr:hypothetical protein [Lysinibacillus xylanilyticus]
MTYKGQTAWENLSPSLQQKIESTEVDIVNDFITGSSDKAASAETVKILKTSVDTHTKEVATTDKLGHFKPDGSTITVDPETGVAKANYLSAITTAVNASEQKMVAKTSIGQANGVASLGSDGKVPASQIVAPAPTNLANDAVTVYVDNVSGNDSNTGASAGTAVKTLAEAVRRIKNLGAKERKIMLVGGRTFDEELNLENIHGSNVQVNCEPYDNRASVKTVKLDGCSAQISLMNFDVEKRGTIATLPSYGVYVYNCSWVGIYSMKIVAQVNGVECNRVAYCRMNSLEINNAQRGAVNCTDSYAIVDSMKGTGNNYGFYASSSIIIGDAGTLSAATPQRKYTGGQIFF